MTLATAEWLLTVASIIVIVGVLLEGHELWEEIKHKGWKPIWPKLGFGILIIGLAAETLMQSRIEIIDDALKRESDVKLADTQKEAGRLSSEAKTAEGKIADAQKEAATANRAAAEATERAARIEQAAAWRILTPEQISSLVSSLSASKHTVQIAFMKGDPESQFLELQFADVVHRAGWEFGSWEVHLERVVFFGLAVLDKPDNEAGRALSQALSFAGIGADPLTVWPGQGYEGDGGYHEAEITLLIGSKFPPPIASGATASKPLPNATP